MSTYPIDPYARLGSEFATPPSGGSVFASPPSGNGSQFTTATAGGSEFAKPASDHGSEFSSPTIPTIQFNNAAMFLNMQIQQARVNFALMLLQQQLRNRT